MISDAMYFKARSLLEEDCHAEYRRANPTAINPRAKPKPWTTTQRCADLIAALNKGDAEQVAAIMMYQFYY